MEMQEKKTPTVEQVMEYRTWMSKLTDESMEKITAFEREYDVFTKIYEEDGHYGVKDACGEVLMPALFDDIASTFMDECRRWAVPVVNDGKMALVAPDGKGTLLIPFDYDKIHFYFGFFYLFLLFDSYLIYGLTYDKMSSTHYYPQIYLYALMLINLLLVNMKK